MSCRSGCPTQDHESWGACLRAAALQLAPAIMEIPGRRHWDAELREYGEARRQGIQPRGTRMAQVRAAVQAAGA
ncbi:hypothetical protein [Umezawaea sp. NPDC059074]|uniref:hypothetical protein n=1 Tax=Umezawaea sp. NPDC059074 TaxID=3346716 RepID=UPI00367C8380